MSEGALFQLSGVRKDYDDVIAVDLAELCVKSGEILCLLGPTGAGKSTLLRMLAGVEAPTAGRLHFEGCPLDVDLPLHVRRRITMVFQRPLLLSGTVRTNLEYGQRIRGGRASGAAAAQGIIERLGLSGIASQRAHTLSGGQTQRVALARALVVQPEVLLLDEPTANLDPSHVVLVEEVIADDHNRRRTTIVWATHNMFQARRVATRVALLIDGRLVEVAATDKFFESPADLRVRDFVQGKMVY